MGRDAVNGSAEHAGRGDADLAPIAAAAARSASGGGFTDGDQAFGEADSLVLGAIVAGRRTRGRPVVVGLSGAQGSGKSTMAARLVERLGATGLRAAAVSLDDFYLLRAERAALAQAVHPLLATRGVPGTHDVALAGATIDALLGDGQGDDRAIPVPRFDKTRDDRAPQHAWPRHAGPLDAVLLEGWCVGARPMPEAGLAHPINALERDEDRDGAWRRHVNAALRSEYGRLWNRLDLLVLLRAPGFEHVHAWRTQQERGLAWSPDGAAAMMDEAGIRRFVAHYERLTRWILEDEPADMVLDIAADRRPLRWRPGRRQASPS